MPYTLLPSNDPHAEYCIRDLEVGKHVMVEKPLALSVEDCLRVGSAVQRTGRKLMTAFKMRYFDMIAKAKELIPQPLVFTMQMTDSRWDNGVWANDPITEAMYSVRECIPATYTAI